MNLWKDDMLKSRTCQLANKNCFVFFFFLKMQTKVDNKNSLKSIEPVQYDKKKTRFFNTTQFIFYISQTTIYNHFILTSK